MTAYEPVSSSLVSIIVPARNEEASLGACLESLVAQIGVNFEIIVINDHSSDRTAEIARSFSQVRLIDAPDLPAGWTGKNNAVTAGARTARGAWFLFTDADTVHSPGSLAKALAEAKEHGAALLSYSPEQEVRSFAEKALMPVIFAELAANFRPKDVSDPASPVAAANGQYLLITRDAYESVGGHAAIAGNILEDVALARAVKSAGFKIFFQYGGDAVRTRMYRTFPQMREGWTKNLALLFPAANSLALRRLTEFLLILCSVLGGILFAAKGFTSYAAASVILALVLYGMFLHRIRKAHFSRSANLCALAGLPLFSYLLWRSALLHRRGKVEWKGRAYASRPSDARPEAKQNQALLASPLAKHKSNF